MSKKDIIEMLKTKEIKKIFEKINIEHLYLVGSFARWENTEKSDLDLVYERWEKSRIGWLEFMKNKLLLEEKLNIKIDLVNEKYIYKDIREKIEKDKILIY